MWPSPTGSTACNGTSKFANNPFYRVATIPGGMSAGTDGDTTTFGVGATFVTSASHASHAGLPTVQIQPMQQHPVL